MTNLKVLVNYIDPDINYLTTPANYIEMSLAQDYLIWTEGNTIIKDLMTYEPTPDELNAASTHINPSADKTVNLCLLMDYSADVGGSYYTHEVLGMADNKRYVFCFSFDGATATEPQLETWDNNNHNTTDNHVLGNGTPANSFVKAVCTTDALPGAGWAGVAIAGSGVTRVLPLNSGNGALIAAKDLYANIKIVIPGGYLTPIGESYIFSIRFTWS